MDADLFAGLFVSDLKAAEDWLGRLLGTEPAFRPTNHEAVFEIAEHRYLYVETREDHTPGGGLVTLFVPDLTSFDTAATKRGIKPAQRETYDNGVTKLTYLDPDGNEIGVAGNPTE